MATAIEKNQNRTIDPDDERAFMDAIEKWVEGEVKPVVMAHDHGDIWPEELVAQMAEMGLFGATIGEEYGGLGMPATTYAKIIAHISSYWMAITGIVNSHLIMATAVERFGTPEQKAHWLPKFARGEIRGGLALTEPNAGTDLQAIRTTAVRDGDDYVINGHKWWSSGSGDSRCKLFIFMGKTDPGGEDVYRQQSMILVPRDTPGITIKRMLPVFGFSDAPHGHGEIIFDNVRVPATNMLLGEGRGFEIAQGRLGPGRIHHCMRLIGQAEVALEKMCRRAVSREPFGKPLSDQGVTRERIAESRILIDQARLLTLNAADKMDKVGNREARKEIGMIKVAAPNMACQVIDWAIQAHGGGGVSNDFGLSYAYSRARAIRLADGPDEVHRDQIARLELRQYTNRR